MVKLYTAAVVATKPADETGKATVGVIPTAVLATHQTEAEMMALRFALVRLPSDQGWQDHNVHVGEIADMMVLAAAEELSGPSPDVPVNWGTPG